MKEQLSIEEISRRTGLEESLLRFYESEYPEALPEKILQGDHFVFGSGAEEAFLGIHHSHSQKTTSLKQSNKQKRYARVLAVTSGKGGVGKTNIVLNLAIELQRLGKMCVVLDADMGLANLHLLAGLMPKHDIMDVVEGRLPLSQIIMEGPEGIGLVPGGSGTLALADAGKIERHKIISALEEIEGQADIILVDTGAGMGAGVRDFLASADELLFVLTPDITSLTDAYGLLKTLHQENLAQRPLYSIVNMVETLRQAADVAQRFSLCARQFLGRQVESLGYLLKDSSVGAAIARRVPYAVFNPNSRISKNTRNLAISLMKKEQPELRLSSAFGRYRNLLRSNAIAKKHLADQGR
ncbi:MAG: AAA family ATPase [Deltaproteobacteria bacterium]